MTPTAFLSRQPLRRQVVAATIIIVIPLIAVMVWSAQRVLAERQADLRDESASIVSTAQSALNQYLSMIDSVGALLIEHPAVKSFDAAGAERLFAKVVGADPVILNITLIDRQGGLHATAIPTEARASGLRPYAQQVLETGRPAIGEFMIGRISGRATVALAYPVRDASGATVGVLAVGLNLTELGKVFANIPLPPGSVITLTDSSSRVLARTLEPEKYVGTMIETPGDVRDPRAVPRTVVTTGVDGVSRVFGNTAITRGPWLLSVGIPAQVAVARALPLWRRSVAISVAFVLLALLIGLLLASWLATPVEHLTAAAQRIADGDLSQPPATPTLSREVSGLHHAFERMARNLRDARDRLDRQVDEERRMREVLQSLQRQVVRQERLAAVGVLVSGVAHELNNPLQAILGSAELLERRPDLPPAARDDVELVKTQSERARDIIRNLSRFSSPQSGPATLIDLREVVSEAIQLRQRDLSLASIALDVEIGSTRHVHANFTEIQQVVLNFIINAQHAIQAVRSTGGRIMIRVLDDGKRVRLEVIDDGPGVKPEDEPKLFQPFFTTKPVGKGTGLGLSVSYGIIESYGGTIGYRSNRWGGATFFFELPTAAAPTATNHDRTALLHGPATPRV